MASALIWMRAAAKVLGASSLDLVKIVRPTKGPVKFLNPRAHAAFLTATAQWLRSQIAQLVAVNSVGLIVRVPV